MHPIKPELNGRDVSGVKDPNGLHLFRAFVAKVREGGKGFVAYQWPKPGSDKPVDKISYVQGFEPWGWSDRLGHLRGRPARTVLRQIAIDAAIVLASLLLAGYLFLSFYRVMDGGLGSAATCVR